MEFKSQTIQLDNSREIFTSRMDHVEGQISELRDEVEGLNQINQGTNRRN